MTERRERDTAEWVTFGIASALLAVLVGLVVLELLSTDHPAAPVAAVERIVRQPDGSHHVEVMLANEGDDTASNVQVTASLTIGGEVDEGDQVVDFLPGDGEEDLVFVFADDPEDGELSVEVTSFASP